MKGMALAQNFLHFPFSGCILNTHEKRRKLSDFLASRLLPVSNPHAVICKADALKVFVTTGERKWLHPILSPTGETVINLSRPVYVGENLEGQYNLFVTDQDDIKSDYLSSGNWVDARALFSHLEQSELPLLGLSIAMYQWLESFRFCPRCGGNIQIRGLGSFLRCSQCKAVHYPTVSPAIIVAVLDGNGNVLLSQRKVQTFKSPGNKPIHTILAGHVSPGECLEDAVVREVLEESNVAIKKLCYVGSQPWPFPSQLMACYYALAISNATLKADQDELLEVRWACKEDVKKALQGNHPDFSVPPAFTASHTLLSAWVEGKVETMGFTEIIQT